MKKNKVGDIIKNRDEIDEAADRSRREKEAEARRRRRAKTKYGSLLPDDGDDE